MTQHKPLDVEAWLQALGQPGADRDYLPGHQRVIDLLDAASRNGFSLRKPPLRIRIAGTNGKGSTAHFLAQALQANGYRVGLYTSPHIVSFHERIQVNAVPVSQADLLALMQRVMPLALDIGASYFETATVLALIYFAQQKVDVEILEAGVGARLDATTAVPADVGLLTPVALDHQEWLGDSLTAIAREKVCVFDGCKVKVSAAQAEDVWQELADREVTVAKAWHGSLRACGAHQRINAGLAWQALQHIQASNLDPKPLKLEVCRVAIAQTVVAGRMQHIRAANHVFWLDAAHNEHAVQALLPTLESFGRPFDVVVLCSRPDRDLSRCVPWLRPFARHMVVMTGDSPYPYDHICQALDAETRKRNSAHFLILGSFVTLGAVMRWLGIQASDMPDMA